MRAPSTTWMHDLPIAKKLALSLTLITLIVLFAMANQYFRLEKLRAATDDVLEYSVMRESVKSVIEDAEHVKMMVIDFSDKKEQEDPQTLIDEVERMQEAVKLWPTTSDETCSCARTKESIDELRSDIEKIAAEANSTDVERNSSVSALGNIRSIEGNASILYGNLTGRIADAEGQQAKLSEDVKLFYFSILGALIGTLILMGYFYSKTIIKPVKDIREAVRRASRKDFSARATVMGKDEFGQFAEAFNKTISELKSAQDRLQTYNLQLEQQVQERTKDLRGKIIELENARRSLEETKRIQEDFNRQLEKKVHERTASLEHANKEIKSLLVTKTRFVNQIAHDLRTPLTPIKILLPLLKPFTEGQDETTRKNYEMIERNLRYLEELVKDTLNIARLDSGTEDFNMQPYDIRRLIDDTIEENKAVFTQGQVEVRNLTWHRKVLIDELHIKEVLENLIMNAVKFMDKKPRTLVFSTEEKKGMLVVSVEDNGIGIAKEHLRSIFDEFSKIDAARHEHGSGLGLAISRRIVAKHGGEIWAKSDGAGKGATISFTIPIAQEEDDKDDESIGD